jgi:hypothetical protein
MPGTLAEKVWDAHIVRRGTDGAPDLLYIDLHLIHEVTSPQAFEGLRMTGRKVRRPDLTIATEDHNTPTLDIDLPIADVVSRTQIETLRANAAEFGVRLHSLGDADQGIVHQVSPQLGLTMPGLTVVCGDSHTSTHGAFGALAFGIGTSEVEHVLATQTLPLAPFKTMAITVDGRLPVGATAKDIILAIIAKIGTGGGQGYVLEYRGEAIRSLSMEARMTVCNMSIEAGARAGMIAPDETTFAYVKGRPHAPSGADWDVAVEYWRTLRSDDDAVFDAEVVLDAAEIEPPAVRERAGPGRDRRRQRAGRGRARSGVHGPDAGHAAARDQGRHGLHRLVHQRSHRGSAPGREGGQGTHEGRGRARPRRAVLRAGPSAGRGRGPGPGLHRLRCRVAQRRLLDVPRHEPRPARAGGALGIDLEPQLRGPAGQGRSDPPGVPVGRGGDRRSRHPVLRR